MGGRSLLRPRAPERRRRAGGRAATARQPATYGSAGAHMEMTFRCTCTPMSHLHSPISTWLTSGGSASAQSRTYLPLPHCVTLVGASHALVSLSQLNLNPNKPPVSVASVNLGSTMYSRT